MRLVFLAICCALSFATYAAEPEEWLQVPKDDAALVVYGDADTFTYIDISDSEKSLDFRKWTFGLPLVKQYRLAPGEYDIFVNSKEGEPLKVDLKAGELKFLRIGPQSDQFKEAILPEKAEPIRTNVGQVVGQLWSKGYAETIMPTHLEPVGNVLYVGTEPPWQIPPPPPKKD